VSEELLIVGVVLLVVVFAIVPALTEDIVPTVVDGVLKSVERVAMALVNRVRPADTLPAERIKELEAEVASLSASVQQLAVAEKDLVERVSREDSGITRE
jgi:hypothetical protein